MLMTDGAPEDVCLIGRQPANEKARGVYEVLGHEGNAIETIYMKGTTVSFRYRNLRGL